MFGGGATLRMNDFLGCQQWQMSYVLARGGGGVEEKSTPASELLLALLLGEVADNVALAGSFRARGNLTAQKAHTSVVPVSRSEVQVRHEGYTALGG